MTNRYGYAFTPELIRGILEAESKDVEIHQLLTFDVPTKMYFDIETVIDATPQAKRSVEAFVQKLKEQAL